MLVRPFELQGSTQDNKIIKRVDSNNFGIAIDKDITVMWFVIPEFKYNEDNRVEVSKDFNVSGIQSGNTLLHSCEVSKDGIYWIKIITIWDSASVPRIQIKKNWTTVYEWQGKVNETVYVSIWEVKTTDTLQIWSPYKQDTYNNITVTFVTSIVYNTIKAI